MCGTTNLQGFPVIVSSAVNPSVQSCSNPSAAFLNECACVCACVCVCVCVCVFGVCVFGEYAKYVTMEASVVELP